MRNSRKGPNSLLALVRSAEDESPSSSQLVRVARFETGCGAVTGERNWSQYHEPKSVAQLAGYEPLRTRLGEALADVLLYLVRLADVLDCDLTAVARSKKAGADDRFPADEVSGIAPLK